MSERETIVFDGVPWVFWQEDGKYFLQEGDEDAYEYSQEEWENYKRLASSEVVPPDENTQAFINALDHAIKTNNPNK